MIVNGKRLRNETPVDGDSNTQTKRDERNIHSSCSNSTGRKDEVEEHKTKFTICRYKQTHTLSHSLPCYSARPSVLSFVPPISCQHHLLVSFPHSLSVSGHHKQRSLRSFQSSNWSEGDNKWKPASIYNRESERDSEREHHSSQQANPLCSQLYDERMFQQFSHRPMRLLRTELWAAGTLIK